MLDLLEAGLAGLRLNCAPAVPLPALVEAAPENPISPEISSLEIHVPLTTSEALLTEIRLSGMSPDDVAKSLGVAPELLDDWLGDRLPVPALALTTLQLLARIAASEEARGSMEKKPAPATDRRKRTATPPAPVKPAESVDVKPEPPPVPPLLLAPSFVNTTSVSKAGQDSSSHPFSRIEDL